MIALVLSVLALLSLLELPVGAPLYRGLLLLAFWTYAPGAALVGRLAITPPTAVALVPVIGLSLLTVASLAGAWTGVWLPGLSLVLVALSTVAATVRSVRGLSRQAVTGARPPTRVSVSLVAGLLVPVALWAASLPAIRTARPSVLGLLVAGPWTLPAALLATLVLLVVALRRDAVAAVWCATAVLILVLRTTASVASPVPIARWTYKHLGVVESLQRYHEVQQNTDIYMNWPGMFSAGAYFADSSGVAVIDLARWITPVIHVVLAIQVAVLARVLGADRRGEAAAATLTVVFNWIGQDYFAPQALAICLAAAFLVLLVQSRDSRTCGVLAVLVVAVIVPTHQLTPFWLLGVAVAFVVLGRTQWWVAGGVLAAALLYLAVHYDVVASYGLFSGFDVFSNAASNVPAADGFGYRVGAWFARGNAVLLWGSAAVVLLVRARRLGWRRARRDRDLLAAAVLVYAPFALLFGQNYGGEAILRVTLYSTVGACALLGPALVRALRGPRLLVVPALVWILVVGAATAQSTFTAWWITLVRTEDVTATAWLAEQPPDSVVLTVLANTPGRAWTDYVTYAPELREELSLDVLIPRQLAGNSEEQAFNPVPLTVELADDVVEAQRLAPTFLVFAQTMRDYDAYYGTYATGAYQEFLDAVRTDPAWRLVRHENDLWIFESTLPGREAP